ncbi:serine/threonine-protein kinase [Haliangium sp.]|uniref:serine/threonine-protein kinase n=1 Tax=Haliangium sp. TaxID=2663208 RepID=UPI003D09FD0C
MSTNDDTEALSPALGLTQAEAEHIDADALGPGARVGAYLIRAELGRGGFGAVYEAEHRALARRVAIKVLHRDLCGSAEMVERFTREARAVNRIRHPNIVDIYDLGTLADGRPYQIMELCDGVSLARRVCGRGRLDADALLALFTPLCRALQAAHEAGVVHRDLKPSNIMVNAGAAIEWVKLLDFGVAKLLAVEQGGWITSLGRVIGTPQTMAPEQLRGERIDHRADIYALGVVLFFAATGGLPFAAGSPALVEQQHLRAAPPAPSRFAPVPAAVDQVVARAMAKDPGERFPSASALGQALAAALRVDAAPSVGLGAPRRAIAVLLKTRLSAHGVVDDEALEWVGDALELAEDALVAAGFTVAVSTRSTVLAVCGHSSGIDPELRRRALDTACALAAELAQADGAGAAAVEVALCVHAGALTGDDERGPTAPDQLGGELVDLRAWPAPVYDGRVRVTRAVMGEHDDARVLVIERGRVDERVSG